MSPDADCRITVDGIVQAMTGYFEIDLVELKSGRNCRAVRARHMAWWLCRQLTDRTLPQIAMKLGPGTDGVTAVLWGIDKIEKAKDRNAQLAADLAALSALFRK